MTSNARDDKYKSASNSDIAESTDKGSDFGGGDGRGGTVPRSWTATVYVDLSTEMYHDLETDAGPDPAAFTRAQAELFSYRACPDCFDSGGGSR